MAEVMVMHRTNIQLDTAVQEDGTTGGKMPFRWRGEIDDAEYDLVVKSDKDAGRELRLERLDKPKPKKASK